MKSTWDTEELANHWSLKFEEMQLLKSKPNRNKAVDDGDMTAEKVSTLGELLEQSGGNLTPANLGRVVTEMAAACGMFD